MRWPYLYLLFLVVPAVYGECVSLPILQNLEVNSSVLMIESVEYPHLLKAIRPLEVPLNLKIKSTSITRYYSDGFEGHPQVNVMLDLNQRISLTPYFGAGRRQELKIFETDFLENDSLILTATYDAVQEPCNDMIYFGSDWTGLEAIIFTWGIIIGFIILFGVIFLLVHKIVRYLISRKK